MRACGRRSEKYGEAALVSRSDVKCFRKMAKTSSSRVNYRLINVEIDPDKNDTMPAIEPSEEPRNAIDETHNSGKEEDARVY